MMLSEFLLLFLLVLVVALIVLRLVSQKYVSDRKPDETHYVRASDGWPIALHRYHPRKKRDGLLPVILCHGLGANRFNFDLDDRRSVAQYFARRGYDVFLLELRGVGKSRRLQWGYPGKWKILFFDFVEKDIPAAIDKVLALTGKEQAHWVGHSMGGMVAYAFAQTPAAEKIRSFTSVAGPGNFSSRKELKKLVRLAFLLKPFPVLHGNVFMKFYAPLAPLVKNGPYTKAMYIRENMSADAIRNAGVNLIAENPTSLMMQFASFITGESVKNEQGYDYQANFDKITGPFLFISGSRDHLAPYDAIHPVYEAATSEDKRYVHFSEENNTHNYGHGDILVGEPARMEVWPVIHQWIEEHP